jgi:hypothetical protein
MLLYQYQDGSTEKITLLGLMGNYYVHIPVLLRMLEANKQSYGSTEKIARQQANIAMIDVSGSAYQRLVSTSPAWLVAFFSWIVITRTCPAFSLSLFPEP